MRREIFGHELEHRSRRRHSRLTCIRLHSFQSHVVIYEKGIILASRLFFLCRVLRIKEIALERTKLDRVHQKGQRIHGLIFSLSRGGCLNSNSNSNTNAQTLYQVRLVPSYLQSLPTLSPLFLIFKPKSRNQTTVSTLPFPSPLLPEIRLHNQPTLNPT